MEKMQKGVLPHRKMDHGFIDNKHEHDMHQEGIHRVKQRPHEFPQDRGVHGKMGKGEKAHWKQGGSDTPRRA